MMMDPPNKLPNSLHKDFRLIPTWARKEPNSIEGTHKEELNFSQISESQTNMRQNNTLQHYFNEQSNDIILDMSKAENKVQTQEMI